MNFLGKEYTLDRQENFDAFLRSSGVPEDKIAALSSEKPTTKLTKNGDTYTMTTTSPKGSKDCVFKSGVEFEDVISDDNIPMKTTITVDGNNVNQVINTPLGKACFNREFTDTELIVTITSDKYDGLAKRYYKA